MCGDGSDYAFLVKFAPEGEPLDNILIGLQGGGVCVFEGDCSAKLQSAPDLFEAMNDQPYEIGITSNDPSESSFANWTKVYYPIVHRMFLLVVVSMKTWVVLNFHDMALLICVLL